MDVTPTVGASSRNRTITIEGKDVNLFIWDTAGEEKFASISPLYVRNAKAAIIATSITDEDSFGSIQKWVQLLNDACDEHPPTLLAVNKIDDVEHAKVEQDGVPERYGECFESVHFVSAYTKEGVDQLFLEAAELAYAFVQKHKTEQEEATAIIEEVPEQEKKGCC